MLTRTLAGRVRPLLAAAGLRGYAPRAAADLVVVGDEEPPPRTASSASAAATVSIAATAPTVLQPRVLIYDGVCHLCHRGEHMYRPPIVGGLISTSNRRRIGGIWL
ncbi:Os06g0237100 [Oryza sativa Japonica Group]|uniref:Os06g0237100 protein n=1 Tax=Oryza sativa subsp. japonica TaxID=39947 RepID=A0A0P0WUX9_ORYSJ|nr:hypothetical protein EE612_032963 [Oryza sativa]BAS96964.1 Os06g0237100 [Oryza sativa Japonica Group]